MPSHSVMVPLMPEVVKFILRVFDGGSMKHE
jgi:hypothetical protein